MLTSASQRNTVNFWKTFIWDYDCWQWPCRYIIVFWFEIIWYNIKPINIIDCEIISQGKNYTRYGLEHNIEVSCTNNGSEKYSSVGVYFKCYDKNENVISTPINHINSLSPGESWNFNEVIYTDVSSIDVCIIDSVYVD